MIRLIIGVLLWLCGFLTAMGLFIRLCHSEERVNFQPVYVERKGSSYLDKTSYPKLLSEGKRLFSNAGVYLNILTPVVIQDPCPQHSGYDRQSEKLHCLGAFGKKSGLIKNRQITHFTLPLMPYRYGEFLGGLARKTCGLKYGRFGYLFSYSIANAANYNRNGESRFLYSLVAFAHENGHVLGAEHDNYSPNLMHYAANIFTNTNWPLGWNRPAIQQISDCLRRSK